MDFQPEVLPMADPDASQGANICCGPRHTAKLPPSRFGQSFVIGRMQTVNGETPLISPEYTTHDRLGAWLVRWGWGRMDYTVTPGLYALGSPDEKSIVMVSANYKLSFDRLRRELAGMSAWILVLDTNGINVWCAAGKGTFGTGELLRMIEETGLKHLVRHRELILPQLGAPGVAAHLVRKHSGFKVIYGPVEAKDLPVFIGAGMKAGQRMRIKEFGLAERMALAPMELVPALKITLPLALVITLLAGLGDSLDSFWAQAVGRGLMPGLGLVWAGAGAALLGPLLLPWLPGRAFSLKGFWLGLFMSAAYLAAWPLLGGGFRLWAAAACLVMMTALSSFVVMNFTGSSTYTSLSGVRREMRIAVPLQAAGSLLALAGLAVSVFS